MEKEMLEKAQLRLYLKVQIRRIREILSLRRLQLLCKLRMIGKMVATEFDINARLEGLGIGQQFNYLVTLIAGQVSLALCDLGAWEDSARRAAYEG